MDWCFSSLKPQNRFLKEKYKQKSKDFLHLFQPQHRWGPRAQQVQVYICPPPKTQLWLWKHSLKATDIVLPLDFRDVLTGGQKVRRPPQRWTQKRPNPGIRIQPVFWWPFGISLLIALSAAFLTDIPRRWERTVFGKNALHHGEKHITGRPVSSEAWPDSLGSANLHMNKPSPPSMAD